MQCGVIIQNFANKAEAPDYEIRQWDESNYDVNKIPYIKEAYAAKKFAFVSDYARFDILYLERSPSCFRQLRVLISGNKLIYLCLSSFGTSFRTFIRILNFNWLIAFAISILPVGRPFLRISTVLEFGNKKCRKHITKSESPVEVCCNLLRGRIHNGLCNKLIRREIYDKVTPWFIPNMNLFEDVALVPRLIINSKSVAFIAKPLYHYSQENTLSITHKWEPKHIDDMVAAVLQQGFLI